MNNDLSIVENRAMQHWHPNIQHDMQAPPRRVVSNCKNASRQSWPAMPLIKLAELRRYLREGQKCVQTSVYEFFVILCWTINALDTSRSEVTKSLAPFAFTLDTV